MRMMKKEQFYKCLIYMAFCFLILLIHVPMIYLGDDLALLPYTAKESLLEHFVMRYSQNGRICTDVLANAFYRIPLALWKVIDTGVYVVIAMLISYIFTKNTYKQAIVVCALILLYPFEYLATAGYICVSTNYVYTILGILLILLSVKKTLEGKKVSVGQHIISVISIFYVTNHDQTAMVLIGGFFLYFIYLKITKSEKEILRIIFIYLLIAVCSYMFMFFMPGHINRMTSSVEMETWLPEYADWTFFKKIYRGYTSTVAHVIYNNVKHFSLFCFLLFLVTLREKTIIKKMLGAIPVSVILFTNIIGKGKFIHYDFVLPELFPVKERAWGLVALILSVVVLMCIIYTICTAVSKKENRWLLLLLLILAAGSREMMGFSTTIYASHYRTFTFFLYALIVSCLVLLEELCTDNENSLCYAGVASIAIVLIVNA